MEAKHDNRDFNSKEVLQKFFAGWTFA